MEKATDKPVRKEQELPDQTARRIMAEGRRGKERGKRKANNLWLWLGVIILIFILVWWAWSIGLLEDAIGVTNG